MRKFCLVTLTLVLMLLIANVGLAQGQYLMPLQPCLVVSGDDQKTKGPDTMTTTNVKTMAGTGWQSYSIEQKEEKDGQIEDDFGASYKKSGDTKVSKFSFEVGVGKSSTIGLQDKVTDKPGSYFNDWGILLGRQVTPELGLSVTLPISDDSPFVISPSYEVKGCVKFAADISFGRKPVMTAVLKSIKHIELSASRDAEIDEETYGVTWKEIAKVNSGSLDLILQEVKASGNKGHSFVAGLSYVLKK